MMLTFDPALMACMTTEHLIASLECCYLTPCEKELLKRLNAALDELEAAKEREAKRVYRGS